MTQVVQAFQLGSSTVVTLPKKLGIKPGQKLEIKKSKNGLTLRLNKRENLLEILRKTQGAWADIDWEEWEKREKQRRKIELAATIRNKKAW